MSAIRNNGRCRLRLETLEDRFLPAGLGLVEDYINVTLPGDAKEFPSATVDVLANDQTSNLRIGSFSLPVLGTVERVVGAGPNERDLLRYVPGANFRGADSFTYTATNGDGLEETQRVFVSYEQETQLYSPWGVQAPAELSTTQDTPISFVGDDGTPLLAINYGGQLPARVGVLLQWAFSDSYFNTSSYAGELTTNVTREDAAISSYPGEGYVWAVGSIEGVNALLAGLTYNPTPGFSDSEGVSLSVYSYLYSDLKVNVGCEAAGVLIRVHKAEGAPLAVSDEFVVRTRLTSTSLDVLANDDPGNAGGALQLIDVRLANHSSATVSIDSQTNRIRYQPSTYSFGTDVLFYTVKNAAGILAQGQALVKVSPLLLAVATSQPDGIQIEVIDAENSSTISQFRPFDSKYTGGVKVGVTDVDGDGFSDIVAWQTTGQRRMRTFSMWGTLIEDTVVSPFGVRLTGSVDMTVGDMDNDGKDEMIFTGRSARGIEVRSVDGATKRIEMSTVIRGMTGNPQVNLNEDTDRLSVLGRSASGAVVLWVINVANPNDPPSMRVLGTATQVRNLVLRNGALTGLSVTFGDANGDESSDQILSLSFRNGLLRVFNIGEKGPIQLMMDRRSSSNNPFVVALPAAENALTTAQGAVVFTTGDSVWVNLAAIAPSPWQRRIRSVAIG